MIEVKYINHKSVAQLNKQATFDRHLGAISIVLYFVTTIYYENNTIPKLVVGTIHIISCLLLLYTQRRKKCVYLTFTILIGTLALVAVNIALGKNIDYIRVTKLLCSIIVAQYIVLNGISKKAGTFLLWLTVLSMIYLYSTSVNSYSIFENTSRNYCSVFCLLAFFAYANSPERRSPVELLLGSCIVLVVCIFAEGRGGIISGALLFALTSIIELSRIETKSKYPAICIVIVGIILIIGFFSIDSIDFNVFSRFGSATAESSNVERLEIIDSYLQTATANPLNILLGFDSTDIKNITIIKQHGNLHNSYLQLHSFFGIAGLLIVVGVAYNTIRTLISKKRLDLLPILVALLVRSFTDWVFPLSYYDVAIYYMIYISLLGYCKDEKSPLLR